MELVSENNTGTYQEFVDDDNNYWCKSYSVWVAKKGNGEVFIDKKYYKYSTTTSKHIGIFFNESTTTIDKLVKDGTIELVNLN